MYPTTIATDVSVVICTYNGQDRLPEVLDALMAQAVPAELRWEIVVVDNSSTDRTSEVAAAYAARSPVPLKVVVERRQGLAYARRRGLLESTGRIISNLDDDTIVDPTWVHAVHEFFQTHPRAGLVGGRILPKLDVAAPPYFDRVKKSLALSDLGDDVLNLTLSPHGHPIMPHSGCRREAIKPSLLRESFEVTGRCGNKLSSCEDSVLAIEVRRAGWEWWYNPAMQMQHHIPPRRLTEDYLCRLLAGMGESAAQMKKVELGRVLTLAESVREAARLAVRYVYYSVVRLIGRQRPARQFARMAAAMYRSGTASYFAELRRTVTGDRR